MLQFDMQPVDEVRIDKWLWAVRIYKTRSIATHACRAGKVKIGGQSVKPSRPVRLSETITAQTGHITRTLKVLGFLESRVSAAVAREFVEDQTPAEELSKRRQPNFTPLLLRPKGAGRPSKKDRRAIDRLLP
jgi:ribosome-associated heat shock protein Hsp15